MNQVTFSKIIGESGLFIDGDWVESKDQDINGDVRLIQLADIGDGHFINKSNRFLTAQKAKELKCTYLRSGDLLIARMPDPIGRGCIFPELEIPCVTVVDICIVRPDPNIANAKWLKFLVNSLDFRNKIKQYIKGTTRQRISRGNLEKLNFILPTLTDQIKIAQILTQAEKLIAQRKESIALLDEFLRSTFLEMFGDPVRNENGWEVKKLNEIIKVGTGGTPNRKREAEFYDGTINWAKTTEVNGNYIYQTEERITELAVKESNCKIYPKNTILMAMYGQGKTRGNVGMLKIEAATNQACAAILPSDNINQVFLFELFKHCYNYLRSLARGGNQENLNLSIVGHIDIIKPPLFLQTQFAHIVEKTEALKIECQSSLLELENLFGTLSQKAFKGELDLSKMIINDKEIISKPHHKEIDQQPTENVEVEKKTKPVKEKSFTQRSMWGQKSILGKISNLQFNNVEGEEVFKKVFSKKDQGFSFVEFESFIKKEGFKYEYNQLKDFIFTKLASKELTQYYADKEWMDESHRKHIGPTQDDFAGDGSIYLVPKISAE